ncbi:elongation factor Tu [Aggregatibacter actinomycetemcomitans]|uniref:elongation factor Tu n=1 Tax=Aggregatibacter actinomycetemcomitans TaxID=714 RepID=UPI0011D9D8A7|nr:elongation factor Tu [Aggregatibacter actinomycetemcomitans]
MSKEKFNRTKPVVNVGTMVKAEEGKTMLTAAVTAALAKSLAKERDDWRKWRQSGGRNKEVINGIRNG